MGWLIPGTTRTRAIASCRFMDASNVRSVFKTARASARIVEAGSTRIPRRREIRFGQILRPRE